MYLDLTAETMPRAPISKEDVALDRESWSGSRLKLPDVARKHAVNGWLITTGLTLTLLVVSTTSAQPVFNPQVGPPMGSGSPVNPIGQDPYFPRTAAPAGNPNFTPPPQAAPAPNGVQTELPLELFEPGKLVARVGDLPIFYGEILGDLNQIVEQEMPDASDTIKDLRRKQLFRQLLPRMVEQKMVYADFLRNMPDQSRLPEIMEQLDKGFFDSELANLMEKVGVSSAAELEQKLRSMGSSLRNVRQAWRESQVVGFYIGEKFKDKKEVTHQEMLDYYRDHLAEYEVPARVRWEQLMAGFDQFPNKADARRAIEAMGNEVVFGAPLDAVAKRQSQGPMASLGGQHDWTSQGSLINKQVEGELFRIPLNYLSDIIESEQGFHIVRVKERESAFTRPFVEVQTEIKEQILAADKKAKLKEFLETLEEEIPVWTILEEEEKEASSAQSSFGIPIR